MFHVKRQAEAHDRLTPRRIARGKRQRAVPRGAIVQFDIVRAGRHFIGDGTALRNSRDASTIAASTFLAHNLIGRCFT